jgi:hypothetical protein
MNQKENTIQMNHKLHIYVLGQESRVVDVKTDVGEFPLSPHPNFVRGKIFGLNAGELHKLSVDKSVIVGVSAKRYKFVRLERSGAFALRKHWDELLISEQI